MYDLKQKYDSDEADQSPGIMPMYNVEQDMEFIFRFNTDLGSEAIGKTLSVHTDIEALPESKVATLEDSQLVDGKSVYSIKPLGFGVLPPIPCALPEPAPGETRLSTTSGLTMTWMPSRLLC